MFDGISVPGSEGLFSPLWASQERTQTLPSLCCEYRLFQFPASGWPETKTESHKSVEVEKVPSCFSSHLFQIGESDLFLLDDRRQHDELFLFGHKVVSGFAELGLVDLNLARCILAREKILLIHYSSLFCSRFNGFNKSWEVVYLEFPFVLFSEPPDPFSEFLLDFFPATGHFRFEPVHCSVKFLVSLALKLACNCDFYF